MKLPFNLQLKIGKETTLGSKVAEFADKYIYIYRLTMKLPFNFQLKIGKETTLGSKVAEFADK